MLVRQRPDLTNNFFHKWYTCAPITRPEFGHSERPTIFDIISDIIWGKNNQLTTLQCIWNGAYCIIFFCDQGLWCSSSSWIDDVLISSQPPPPAPLVQFEKIVEWKGGKIKSPLNWIKYMIPGSSTFYRLMIFRVQTRFVTMKTAVAISEDNDDSCQISIDLDQIHVLKALKIVYWVWYGCGTSRMSLVSAKIHICCWHDMRYYS